MQTFESWWNWKNESNNFVTNIGDAFRKELLQGGDGDGDGQEQQQEQQVKAEIHSHSHYYLVQVIC